MTDRMADNIRWFFDNLDDVPLALHQRGVEPDSVLGAPQIHAAFAEWLYRSARAWTETETEVPCHHVAKRSGQDCPTCTIYDEEGRPIVETGTRRSKVTRYRWPMRAVMAKVGEVTVPKGYPSLSMMLWQLAVALRSVATYEKDMAGLDQLTSGSIEAAIERISEVLAWRYPMMSNEVAVRRHLDRALRAARQRFTLTPPPPRRRPRSEAQLDAEAAV